MLSSRTGQRAQPRVGGGVAGARRVLSSQPYWDKECKRPGFTAGADSLSWPCSSPASSWGTCKHRAWHPTARTEAWASPTAAGRGSGPQPGGTESPATVSL